MEGDTAPLAELDAVAKRHDAMLVIDEAHATGVLGPDGRGLACSLERAEHVIVVHTCGKALGAQGALVCATASTIDFLVNRSRAFIYTTAPSPLMAAATRAALGIVRSDAPRRQRLLSLVKAANDDLRARCRIATPGTQIIPVIVGAPTRAMSLARLLQARGFDVRGIRPPTVPEGTARLRISITLNVDEATTRSMIGALAEELTALPA
jgi:8-amino-7-oxononanoate synthase